MSLCTVKTGLFVEPGNVDSVAQAIRLLLKNTNKARDMGQRARKLVLEQYTWEKNAQWYLEIYREMVARNG